MTKLHQYDSTVKAIGKYKLALLFVLVLALFLPVLFSNQGVLAASSVGRIARQESLSRTPIATLIKPHLFVSMTNSLAPKPAPKPRRAFQWAWACNTGDFECTGALCRHECLGCPSGWTVTATGPCCAKCCQGLDNCGDVSCCIDR